MRAGGPPGRRIFLPRTTLRTELPVWPQQTFLFLSLFDIFFNKLFTFLQWDGKEKKKPILSLRLLTCKMWLIIVPTRCIKGQTYGNSCK